MVDKYISEVLEDFVSFTVSISYDLAYLNSPLLIFLTISMQEFTFQKGEWGVYVSRILNNQSFVIHALIPCGKLEEYLSQKHVFTSLVACENGVHPV